MNKIVVLMSTFNGEKYIEEQLDSIFAQKDVDLNLIVRDDGSTDNTKSILRHYQKCYPLKTELIEGENIGWRKSFFSLITYAAANYGNYDYFAFSDQDDVWLPEKTNHAIKCIKESGPGIRLYCSNLIYYKDNIQHGMFRKKPVRADAKKCLVRNYATGCTIVFNKELLSVISKELPKIEIAHDYWTYMTAALCGSVIIDHNSHILYRQHDSNQIGCETKISEIWKRRLSSLRNTINNHSKELIAKELLRIYKDNMTNESFASVKKMADYKKSIKNRLSLFVDSGYTFDKASSDFWFKLRILFGIL